MAINVATHAADAMAVQRGEMTPRRALRLAWLLWLTMLALPFVLFMAVLWRLMFQPDQGRPSLAMPFFFSDT